MPTEFARRWMLVGLAVAGAALAGGLFLIHLFRNNPLPPMTQQIYVWQRVWTSSLQEAVSQAGRRFNGLIVLGAEVTFSGSGVPQVVRAPIDFDRLSQSHEQVTLALRIGPYNGPFISQGPLPRWFADLASATIVQARENGIEPIELMIDFECPPGRLTGYGTWIQAIRDRVSPLPVSIMALPDWLEDGAFAELISHCDSYALRVRSINCPFSPDEPMALCDQGKARAWVERASNFGRKFRVALPTYDCQVAFTAEGQFIGLSARGRKLNWPSDAIVRVVPADPAQIAQLVQGWSKRRPPEMTGIIWDRLPHRGDKSTWPIGTLTHVMQGIVPPPASRPE